MKNVILLLIAAALFSCNQKTKEDTWVFILAGQSNMAGRGIVEPEDTVTSERIYSINKEGKIIPAKEPLHFYEPKLAGLDCGVSFGRALIKEIPENVSIILLPTAVGGSSVSQWLGDSTFRNVQLLSNFRKKVEIGKEAGRIKGILWHQGENDANEKNIPVYKRRLSQLFEKFREITGDENLPILIGELGTFSKNNEKWMRINEQIRSYISTDENAVLISTSDLDHKGDMVHFNSEGQRILGQRFAAAYLRKTQKL